jgi:alanyl-tRNA synthetase
MKTNQIRKIFLNYFKKHQHTVVEGSALIPANDPSLLFTNAGMVQFKDIFLGNEKKPYTRATSSQPCLRAGGKHNDLENVGYTARHHTFFEMLGNFSFGDYFKREAIHFAWDFLTQELKLPAKSLWVTVFREDDEAADIWINEIGVDPSRFSRCDEEDNFWSMGDTGPCGPCSEIFYDHGPSISGGPPGSEEADGDRYIEIWNLVFMQYDRSSDGALKPLPKPSVDTGMGLERVASVLQGVHSNYDTDTFQYLIGSIEKILGVKKEDSEHQQSFNVIADHIRAVAFLIADGVMPSNEHRGYVLRRIIRRALRHGHKLGASGPFFYRLVNPLLHEMKEAYPKLAQFKEKIEKAIHQEEEQFLNTLSHGLKLLSEAMQLGTKVLPGKLVFQLYDTHGFPPDLTADVAREQGIKIDQVGFDKCMREQQARSKQSSQFASGAGDRLPVEGETHFIGYKSQSGDGKLIYLFKNKAPVKLLQEGQEGIMVLDQTPFYAESGGQVGDQGMLKGLTGSFEVKDTQKQGQIYLHYGKMVKGKLSEGDIIKAEVSPLRQAIMLNHSATHLLHAALRYLLGEEVVQKGSLVEASRLRFDFSWPKPLTQTQLNEIESLVNQKIRENLDCQIEVTSPEDAFQKGALALFGEKYGEEVRMLSMGDFSKELCGGTHVKKTGDIGLFKIASEMAVASGVRRIEAVTGEAALKWVEQIQSEFKAVMDILKSDRNNVLDKLKQNSELQRQLKQDLETAKLKWALSQVPVLEEKFKNIQGAQVLVENLEGVDAGWFPCLVDVLRQEKDKQGAVILLTSIADEHVRIAAGVTKSLIGKLKAGDLVRFVAEQLGGKGGGRPDWAQGAGAKGQTQELEGVLTRAMDWINKKLEA